MKILSKIMNNLPELNLDRLKLEALAFLDLLRSKHTEVLFLSLTVCLILMLVLIYFQFFKNNDSLPPTLVAKRKFIIIILIASLPLVTWLWGTVSLHIQVNNFFGSTMEPARINSFNEVAPNLPNCRFYLFCKKEPADRYRLSLSRLKSDILPQGFGDIEDFTREDLENNEDQIRGEFVQYSYRTAFWRLLILLVAMALLALIFRIIRIKYRG